MPRTNPRITSSAFGCAAAMAAVMALAAGPAVAGEVSAEQIVRALTKKPITRSLSGPRSDPAADATQARFIDSLRNRPTRSLSSAERDQIAAIADVKPKIDLEINFDYNSAEISAGAKGAVSQLGKALTDPSLKGSTFLLAGHTDAVGTEAYNQTLSERRADTIKRTLIEQFGIDGSQLVTVGYGKQRLKNAAAPFDSVNRRVQVVTMTSQTASAQ